MTRPTKVISFTRHNSKEMITFKKFIFNGVTKSFENNKALTRQINDIYQENVDNLSFNRCICNKCKSKGNFYIHGYYYRNIMINYNYIPLRITRIQCRSCLKTDAVFFYDFIPYYHLTASECLRLLLNDFKDFYYDDSLLVLLKKRYDLFTLYLKSICLNIKNDIASINLHSIPIIIRSYLQIHFGLISLGT